MVVKRASNTPSFSWKSADTTVVRDLHELFGVLVEMPLGSIDREIGENIGSSDCAFLTWLQENFPKEIELVRSVEQAIQEMTPQQIRELMIRILRKRLNIQE